MLKRSMKSARRPRRHGQHGRRNRASAVILVVVALVLMALVGAAYLQQTRTQRFAMAEPRGNIDAVVNSIIGQIQSVLIEDLINDDDGTAVELYDYPWTNPAVTSDNSNDWTPEGFSGPASGTAYGGYQDDMWLASPQPDFGSDRWPHLTNLTGLFLRYDAGSNQFVTSGGGEPENVVADIIDFDGSGDPAGGADENRDSFIDITSDLLADASGDGIGDSRWAWPPLREIDGISYVMAVRIVDLSAKLNVNTKMSLADDVTGTIATGAEAPLWHTPSELDLGRFVYGRNTGLMGELRDTLRYRFGDPTTMPLPVPRADRETFWEEQGRFYRTESGYRQYGSVDEYELRHRDGLNSGRLAPIVNGMTQFLRGDVAEERDHTDVGALYGSRYGGSTGDADRDFYEIEPRKHLTTFSGAAAWHWPLAGDVWGDTDTDDFLKLDLRDGNVNPDQVRSAFEDVYQSGNAPSWLPGGFAMADVAEAGWQFTANLENYRRALPYLVEAGPDPDDPSEPLYFGLTPLPIITELYTQTKYSGTAEERPLLDSNDDPVTDGSGNPILEWWIMWERRDPTGYAIEIRNPFDTAARLDSVQLAVTVGGTDEWVATLSDLVDDGSSVLEPGDVLVLYRPSDPDGADDPTTPDDDMTVLVDESDGPEARPEGGDWGAPDHRVIKLDDTYTWPTQDATEDDARRDVHVQLRPAVGDGVDTDWADWAYFVAKAFRYPEMADVNAGVRPDNSSPLSSEPATLYWQNTVHSDGRGMYPLAIGDDLNDHGDMLQEVESDHEWLPEDDVAQLPSSQHDSTAVDKLGLRDKDHPYYLASLDLDGRRVHLKQDELTHAGELAHLFVLGPNEDNKLADRWQTGLDDAEAQLGSPPHFEDVFMLNFKPDQVGVAGDVAIRSHANHLMTHAALLVDRFTLFNPREDGEDNNHDGTNDSPLENIVPGLVNLNTMPDHLLRETLPIEDADRRNAIVDAILHYRDGDTTGSLDPSADLADERKQLLGYPVGSSLDARQNPGIANVGELFRLLENLVENDTDVEPNGTALPRHKRMELARWLSTVGSTRSDYFAAYIYVRGYSDFDVAPHLGIHESARVIVVFERNADDGEVRVAALLPGGRPYTVR